MNEHFEIIKSIKNKKLLDKEFINKYLNKNLLIIYLSQNENTIDIALYISKNMLDKDLYQIYLYTLSKFPKNLDFIYIKNNNDDIYKNINLFLDILNSNNNDVINTLKIINKNNSKLINKIKDIQHSLSVNNEEFEDDVEKEIYFLNIQ